MPADSARLSETDNRTWHVRLEDLDLFIKACYPTTDANMPGWTVLKDHHHKVTAAVRDDAVLLIERSDAVVPASQARDASQIRG
jgi:hypothetical protein